MRPRPEKPAAGQESVWDYPRPPALEPTSRHLVVEHSGRIVADSCAGFRVLETSHPPVYYLPPADVDASLLRAVAGATGCEWKGRAAYFDVLGRTIAARAAWAYPLPEARFERIAGYIAFYAGRVDRCLVDGVVVTPQPGDFYGGWITPDVVGPFKGIPGSFGW